MLICIHEKGSASRSDIVSKIGTTPRGVKGDNEMLSKAVQRDYLKKNGDFYSLQPEALAYVSDVVEIVDQKPKGNLVQSRIPNIWTNEMRNYESSLFAGKRGY